MSVYSLWAHAVIALPLWSPPTTKSLLGQAGSQLLALQAHCRAAIRSSQIHALIQAFPCSYHMDAPCITMRWVSAPRQPLVPSHSPQAHHLCLEVAL